MKKLILLFVGILFVSCDSNPDYEKNLATAKKLFELHGEEKFDEQLALVSKDIKLYTPILKLISNIIIVFESWSQSCSRFSLEFNFKE